ncbi:flagellar protein FlaG [Metabacillus halosaccharovorans]|uniref:flagellar protein FlaG n=1 Tax=Bacillaceae TaxID=186817 RepID=UPI00047D4CAC|nr:flagellar protein FlaG [Bacillus sp. J37]
MSVENISSQSALRNIDQTQSSAKAENRTTNSEKQDQDLQLKEKPSRDDLEKTINIMNDFLQASNTHIKFKLHDKLNEYYVTIVDDQDKVIREIPSEKMLDIYASMTDFLGLIVDKKI